MSEENVHVIERLGEVLSAKDLVVRWNDERLLEEGKQALAAAAWPDFSFSLVAPDPAFRGEYKGVDGFVEGFHDWLSAFDSYTLNVQEVIGAGDRLVGLGRMRATPKGTGAAIEQEAASVFTFEDGKIRSIEFHLDQATALKAAGLDPQSFQE